MEQFINEGHGPCIVLKRAGDIALICCTENTYQPFVVPLSHISGRNYWYHGEYFGSLDDALAWFNKQAKEDVE